MYPKNIQEYIVESVIKHNKYRDDEIKELERLLVECDVSKCDKCLKYKIEMYSCHLCQINCCFGCSETEIKTFISYNTYDRDTKEGFTSFKVNVCNKCILNLCVKCIDSKMCKDCTNKLVVNL